MFEDSIFGEGSVWSDPREMVARDERLKTSPESRLSSEECTGCLNTESVVLEYFIPRGTGPKGNTFVLRLVQLKQRKHWPIVNQKVTKRVETFWGE